MWMRQVEDRQVELCMNRDEGQAPKDQGGGRQMEVWVQTLDGASCCGQTGEQV